MISRAIYRQRRGRRAFTALAAVSLIAGLFYFSGSALGITQSEFELDKNATNDLTTVHLGVTKSQVRVTATSIEVCQISGVAYPATPFTILIDGEQMTVTSLGATSTQTGGCTFGDPALTTTETRIYNVTRSSPVGHPGDSDVTRLITGTVTGDDWNQVYTLVTGDTNDEGDDDKCIAIGAVECSWVNDPFNVSVFTTGGSKDDLNINPLAGEAGNGWKWTDSSVPPSDEILDAFAAKYVEPGTGRQLLFFGADRWATNGAKDFGFWFFRDEVGLNPDGTFSGNHTRRTADTRGDILLLGTFTQGGAVTSLRVFEWVGTGGDTNGTLDDLGAFGDCVPGPGNAEGCNTVNDTTVPAPWPYQGAGSTNVPGVFYSGALMEGGLDLTLLGLEGCFSSFLAETRSAPEVGAQLKDFALGSFEVCETAVDTDPADGEGTVLTDTDGDSLGLPDIALGTGSAGVDVTDNATVTVTGVPTWSGTVDFFICGPIADPDTCDAGGVDAGDAQAVDQTTPTATSPVVNLTEVGRYCWRGEFTPSETSANQGVEPGEDASIGECFEVLPVQPTLDTQAVDGDGNALSGPVSFGSPVYDKATLSGTAYQPGTDGTNATYPSINATMDTPAGGTITFELRGPDGATLDCTTVAAGSGSNPEDVTVNGDGDYFTTGFTPDSPGDYHWVASYSGDSPNTLSTDHNTACDDTDEDVTVQQLQPTMDTAQEFVPNDSATVTVEAGAGDLDGDVVFKLYVDNATCTGDADATFGPFAVLDTDDPGDVELSDTVESDNTTAYDVDGTTFNWVVEFTSNNSAHLDVTSGCGNETSSITIDNGVTQPAAP